MKHSHYIIEVANRKGRFSMHKKQIILFDGDCNFCDQSVQFIIKRDPEAIFHFASLESEAGKELRKKYHLQENINSMVLIKGEHTYLRSTAALQIARQLTGMWKLSYFLILIPRSIRDFFYQFVAKHRYTWFGKMKQCRIPSPEVRRRFF